MTESNNKTDQNSQDNTTNANNINRGKPIYYKGILHYIVYEFDNNILISKNKDLSRVFVVNRSSVSVRPKKAKK